MSYGRLARRLAFAAAVAGFACTSDRSVGPGPIISLGVSPASPTLAVGDSVQLKSIGVDEHHVLFIGLPTEWSSSDNAVATVSSSGMVTAQAVGSATITAAAQGFAAMSLVTVAPPPAIVLSTNAVGFSGIAGGPAPAPDSVLITNGGGTTLDQLTVDSVVYGAGATGWLSATITTSTAPTQLDLTASMTGVPVGTFTATVYVGSLEATNSPQTVTVTLTSGVGAPATVTVAAGDTQQAAVNTAVPIDPAVRVTDQFGNGVPGVEVVFAVTGGGGSTTAATDTTDATGVAAVGSWTLGTGVGAHALSATATPLPGSPVAFTATAVAGPAAQIAVSAGDTQSAIVGTPVATPPAVFVSDQFGNAAAGAGVTFSVTGGGGNLTSGAATADSTGIATVGSWTLGNLVGANQLTATITGSAIATTFSATGTPAAAAQIAGLAGDSQTAAVGSAVATAPAVRVTDPFGNPVQGVEVTFAVGAGGGNVTGATDSTDATGVAAVGSWTLGTTAGANSLTATAPGLNGSPVLFAATGAPAAASQITLAAGNGQNATVNTAVATAPAVLVRDPFNNPVPGVEVVFAVTAGGGNVAGATDTTDALGIAAVGSWTLGTVAGANALQATAPGLAGSPLSFSATGTPAGATTIALQTGNGQSATAGSAVAIAPAVMVTDQHGNGVPGETVTFAVTGGGGNVTGGSAITNASGVATVGSWTLGTTAGPNALSATRAGLTGSPVAFTATGLVGAATTIAAQAGNGQTATAGSAVAIVPTVRVTDQHGNGVPGVIVAFAVTGGGGSTTAATDTTDATGFATPGSWTLGVVAGPNALQASAGGLGGSPVTFTATGTAGAATQISLSAGDGQTATVNAFVGTAPAVLVRDALSNPVAGVIVTFAVTGGGGSATGATDTTDAGGHAAVGSWRLGTAAGVNTLQATSAGLAGSPVTFTATGTAAAASQLAVSAGNGQTATVNAAVATAPAVAVTDSFGNPVAGIAVTFAVGLGGGSITGVNPATTNASGIATVGWILGTTAGNNTLTATNATLGGSPVTFTATAAAGAATQIALSAGNGQIAPAGTAVAIAPAVTVRDQFNNPVPGEVVTFAVSGGGGNITGPTDTTDATGVATVGSWTLGTSVGVNSLTATRAGLAGSPVAFSATGIAGAATQIAIDAGNGQNATVNTAVAVAPAVMVRDQFNNPVPNVVVTFTVTGGGGSTTDTTDTTDTGGLASAGGWILGTTAGPNTLQAATAGVTPVGFTATGTADVATTIAVDTGQGQSATVNSAVAVSPAVVVTDQFGNPVGGVSVTYAVTGGAGNVTGGAPTTNASGIAAVGSWTLGTAAGGNTLEATSGGLSGSPVVFTATGTAGAATQIALDGGNNQNATVNQAVGTDPSVLVRDVFNNPVAGVVVTFAPAAGGGSVTGGTDTTDAAGIASVGSWTLGTAAGTNNNTLAATSAGLAGSPVLFTASANADAAAQLAVFAGDGQSATAGADVPTPPAVLVTDQFGNPVGGGVSVTFAVTGGGGSISGTNPVTTDGAGVAAIGSWTLGASAGANTLTATSAPSLSGSPVTFTATAFAGGASTIALDGGNAQTDTVGATLATVYSVLITDTLGNPVQGVPVSWAVPFGQGSITPLSQTDVSGIAVATRVLGHTAGAQTATAAVGGLTGSPVLFTATATHGAATQIAASAGNGQSATVDNAVAIDPAVTVRDQFNNPVGGVGVTFAVTGGGGSVTGGGATTDAAGVAAVGSWTLGQTAGANTLQATSAGLAGSPVVFTATGTAGAATQMTLSAGDAQSATVNTAVATDPAVLLQDAFNNPVPSVSVTFTPTGGGGSAVGSPATSNASGIATLGSWILGATAGANTLQATAGGVSAVNFSATGTAGAATQIAINAGNAQTATVNTAVGTAPAVIARDQFSNPVSGVIVTFAVTGGGGSTTAATDTTDATGIAAVGSWTLGTTAGANALQASASGLSPVTFTASGSAGAATQMTLNAGNAQTATVNQAVATDPAVLVRDQFNNPVQNHSVTFAVTGGGGSVGGSPALSDANGIATLGSWTLGTAAGANSLQATAAGVSAVNFTATGTADTQTQMSVSAGNGQNATVNTAVGVAPAVLVQDQFNNPVAGVSVSFAVTGGGGSVNGTPATTDVNGIATVGGWTLGTTAGPQTLQATAAGVAAVNFNATGTAAAASQIAVNAGNNQTDTVNTAVAIAPSVLVRDQFNNPVAGVIVTFAVTGGGGNATGATDTTDAAGIASVGSWTLGTVAGANTLQGSAGGLTGSPVNFSATGVAGPPTQMTVSAGNGQSATVNTAVAIDPEVLLRDAFDNPVAGAIVTFAVTGGGGGVTGGTDTTDATGHAAVGAWILGTTAGANALQATATGPTPVNFTATGTADVASQIAVSTGNGQNATVNTAVSIAPAVVVRDAFNNPVAGVSVTFAVTGGGGGITGTNPATTNASGVAAIGSWTLGTASGANTLEATSAGLAGSPVVFTATATAGSPQLIALSAGNAQTDTVNQALPINPAVMVTDAFGNGVPNVGVKFNITSGGGSLGGDTVQTNASGVATLGSWTLGQTAGVNTMQAASAGLSGSPVAFSATGVAGAPTQMTIQAGNGQSDTVNTAMPIAPAVLLRDAFNNPVSGVSVTFAVTGGGGSLTGTNPAATNGSGIATIGSWILGTTAGLNTMTATANLLSQGFTATGVAGPVTAAQSLVSVSDNAIAACLSSCSAIGNTLTTVTVTARDQFNNPVSGKAVTISSTGTGNTFTPASAPNTNASGQSQVTFNSTVAQAKTISATAAGVAITQTAGVTVSAATASLSNSLLAVSDAAIVACSSSCSTFGNTATQVTATIRDAFSNLVSGAIVTFSSTGSSNTFTTSAIDTTGAGGTAIRNFNSTFAQAKTISAFVTGVGTVTQTQGVTVSAAAAASVVVNLGNNQTARVGLTVGTDPSVLVRDAFLNPVSGQTVTFSIVNGGGSATGTSPVTNASGVATVTSWTLGSTGTEGAEGSGTFAGQFTNTLRGLIVGVDTATFTAHSFYTYSGDVGPLIGTSSGCNGCHYASWTRANIVNVPEQNGAPWNSCNGTTLLVNDLSASLSLIYQKITTPSCGGQMPGAGGMTTLERRIIRAWINDGALNN